ncbi:MAG: tRNA lysidine(34) synthetase TilS, partial [Acidimicrobiales bacterium]
MGLAGRCHFDNQVSRLNLAVSGGADSVAMLILAAETGRPLTVVHVDHGLRSSSEAEAGQVRDLAEQFGAEFVLHELDLVTGANLEERARLARYAVYPDEVAVAHTVEDQAETVLLAMLRGAGLDGLSGMANVGPGPDPARLQLVFRPILGLRRAETEQLCASRGVATIEDPSNRDSAYRRSRIRYELLPLMADIADRDVAAGVARLAGLLADEKSLLDDLADQIDPCD